jgi:hypothetical protein
MPRHELLNNVAHKDLRVIIRFGQGPGDAAGTVLAFPTEFAELQREYPIFFGKDATSGEYSAVALLGFDRQENLYVRDGRWNSAYLPGYVARGPFLIGFQEQWVEGEARREPVIHVDLDHPAISSSEGEAVFLPGGGQSPYLEHISNILRGIRDGMEGGKAFYAALAAHGLIQPMTVEVRFDADHGANLTGLHGIDRERLAALDAAALHALHQQGFLEGIYLVLASMHNMRRLIAEKQLRLREEAGAAASARTG